VGDRLSGRLIPSIKTLYADGDAVIVYFNAEGHRARRQPYRNTCAWVLQLRDDKIVKATAFYDSVALNDFWTRVTPSALARRRTPTLTPHHSASGLADHPPAD
jgi:ketosteroid isomerase-like protein